jgi:hypothetical protein
MKQYLFLSVSPTNHGVPLLSPSWAPWFFFALLLLNSNFFMNLCALLSALWGRQSFHWVPFYRHFEPWFLKGCRRSFNTVFFQNFNFPIYALSLFYCVPALLIWACPFHPCLCHLLFIVFSWWNILRRIPHPYACRTWFVSEFNSVCTAKVEVPLLRRKWRTGFLKVIAHIYCVLHILMEDKYQMCAVKWFN